MPYDLYVVTDEGLSRGLSHVQIAERAVLGGADVIQLREKTMSGKELLTIARRIRACIESSGALFIVNDRIDIAIASGADGVHLGQDDIPLDVARSIMPGPFIIGISVGSVEHAIRAEEGGADYVAVSPVFGTGSKKDAGPGLGTGMVEKISQVVSIPVIGIGGIGFHNVKEVISAGAEGIAVISAVVSSPDITRTTYELKSLINECKKNRSRV
jgi:thiamine-phosphate pyrophosphorylase